MSNKLLFEQYTTKKSLFISKNNKKLSNYINAIDSFNSNFNNILNTNFKTISKKLD